MSTIKREIGYRCDNDCRMEGCPSHTLKGILQNTSDVVIVDDEKGNYVFSGDINRTTALLKLLRNLDYDGIYFPDLIQKDV